MRNNVNKPEVIDRELSGGGVERQFQYGPDPIFDEQPVVKRTGNLMRKLKFGLRATEVGLVAIGALTIAGMVSDIGLPNIGDIFGDGKTQVEGSAGDVHTDVEEYSGIVSARVEATVDIDLTRTLSRWGVDYCVEGVHEDDLPLSGLMVSQTADMTVIPQGKRVKVDVKKIEKPELGLPLDDPVLSQGDSGIACVQRSNDKKHTEPGVQKRNKKDEKHQSPENVPVVIATDLLKSTSDMIGQCVLNRANDEGSDINKLLSRTIAVQIAADRGISPKDVDVFFNFPDSKYGQASVKEAIKKIISDQKEAGAVVKIDTDKVTSCNAHEITAILKSNN